MKISILGTGRWASCIAFCMDKNNYDVLMWQRPGGQQSPLFTSHANEYVKLSKRVNFTHDLAQALNYGDVVVISILSQNVSDLMAQVKQIPGYKDKHYCLAMKGIEVSTGRRLSEILLDNGVKRKNIAVWAGPGHVQSIVAGEPTNMVISAYNNLYAKQLVESFSNANGFDLIASKDIIGVELGAAAKNVIGIAAGILEGSNMEQKKGPLMAASVKEIGRFIDAMGGAAETACGLAFLGDFQATLYDHNSKNLTYGRLIAEKKTVELEKLKKAKIKNCKTKFNNLPEGVKTAEAIDMLKQRYNVNASDAHQLKMPITQAVNDILHNSVDLKTAGTYLSDKISEALKI